jgi:hypothetical protein
MFCFNLPFIATECGETKSYAKAFILLANSSQKQ